MEGTEPWIYRNIFRPTSLMVTPTIDANKDGIYKISEVGHVNGNLTIGSTSYNWQALPYKIETNTGITTNSFTWTTTNPYGKDVRLNLYSSPSSEILMEKNVGRIGGYNATVRSLFSCSMVQNPSTYAEYRVTALLSSYSNEEAKTANEIAVTGTGHAIHVHSSAADDYIYTGKGNSTFAGFTTDADTAFVRQRGAAVEITLLAGSYLDYQNERWVGLSEKADYVTVKKENGSIDYRIQADTDLRGELFNIQVDPAEIQNSTAAREQKNTVIASSSTSTNTGFFSDLVAFVKKIGKQVISFFNIRL